MNQSSQPPIPPLSEVPPAAASKETTAKSTSLTRSTLASGPAAASENARKNKKKRASKSNPTSTQAKAPNTLTENAAQGEDPTQPDLSTIPPHQTTTPPQTQYNGTNTPKTMPNSPVGQDLPSPPSVPSGTPPRFEIPAHFREASLTPPSSPSCHISAGTNDPQVINQDVDMPFAPPTEHTESLTTPTQPHQGADTGHTQPTPPDRSKPAQPVQPNNTPIPPQLSKVSDRLEEVANDRDNMGRRSPPCTPRP